MRATSHPESHFGTHVRQCPLPAQWSTDGWTIATQSRTARRLRIWTSFKKRVQNSTAWVVTRTRYNDHAIRSLPTYTGCRSSTEYSTTPPSLSTRSWPRIREPMYLTDIIRFHVPSRHLRSCNRRLVQKDRTPTSSSPTSRSLKPHLQFVTIYHNMSPQTFPINRHSSDC